MMNILIILIYEIYNVIWNIQCNINLEFPYIFHLVNWCITITVIFFIFKKMNLKKIFLILIYKSLLPSAGFTVSLHFGIKKQLLF